MKTISGLIIILLAAGLATAGDVSITVYNNGNALVHEFRDIEVKTGVFEYDFISIPDKIDPTSVHFNAPGMDILEQNYEFDIASPQKILEKMAGQRIHIFFDDGTLVDGILQPAAGQDIIVKDSKNGIKIVRLNKAVHYDFMGMPEGFVDVPTLKWLLNSKVSGTKKAEISYLTGGLDWHAEYVAVAGGKELGFTGWVSIDNRSGHTFAEAKLKLMAGEVHMVEDRRRFDGRGAVNLMSAEADMSKGFEEKSFFEYHLYTLQRPSTVRNNQIKQITLFPEAQVKYDKEYIFDARRGNKKIGVYLVFKNSKSAGLGIALPAGKVRVYQRDDDGSQEFIGEDMVEHTPRDEKVRLKIGNAFDIIGERKMTDSRQLGRYAHEEDIEVSLRNHKDEAVTVQVKERFYGNWEILKSTHKYEKLDAYTVEFKVDLPVHKEDQETLVKYTIRYNRN